MSEIQTEGATSPMIRLQSAVAKLEGKKVEVPMGNVREVLARLQDVLAIEATKTPNGFSLGEMGQALMAGICRRVDEHAEALAKGGGVQ